MKIRTLEIAGINSALYGMRNPMDSWERGDTTCNMIGPNDLALARRLIKGGSEHSKFLRQIQVWANMNMPRYWWSEFDTYGFNTKNSCSTMHRLLNNKEPITKDLFIIYDEEYDVMDVIVERLEQLRILYLEKRDNQLLVRAKRLLPEGFMQMRTVNTNYAELRNIYHQRKHHRLKEEWIDVFCKWVETLPYAKELITGEVVVNG